MTDVSIDGTDLFHVIGITNRHHLEGMPDPVIEFFERATAHGEELVLKEGLRPPAVVRIDVEIYSLSFTHKDEFPRYGAISPPMQVGTDEIYMRLYFLSDSAVEHAKRLGVHLPPILGTIRRDELPVRRGTQAKPGAHFWERA